MLKPGGYFFQVYGNTMTIPFTKPSTTHAEQVVLLRQRGMIIDDADQAEFYLKHLNY